MTKPRGSLSTAELRVESLKSKSVSRMISKRKSSFFALSARATKSLLFLITTVSAAREKVKQRNNDHNYLSDEKNLSTVRTEKEKQTRIQRKNVHSEWQTGFGCPQGKRKKKTYGFGRKVRGKEILVFIVV